MQPPHREVNGVPGPYPPQRGEGTMVVPPVVEQGGNLLGKWFKEFGFQTVLATALVGVLIWQSIVANERISTALQRSYDLERDNRVVLLDMQTRLAGISTSQAEVARAQTELARSQADLARAQSETVRLQAEQTRAIERLNDRLYPNVRPGGIP